jgi:hypothetical protein
MVGLDDFEASEKPGVVDVVAPPTHVDDDLPTALAARRRIRYAGDDEETPARLPSPILVTR